MVQPELRRWRLLERVAAFEILDEQRNLIATIEETVR